MGTPGAPPEREAEEAAAEDEYEGAVWEAAWRPWTPRDGGSDGAGKRRAGGAEPALELPAADGVSERGVTSLVENDLVFEN